MPDFESKYVQVHVARFKIEVNDWEFLILKRNANTKLYPGIWQAITGTIEKGEKSILTAKRELLEETSLVPMNLWTVPFVTMFFDAERDNINSSPVFGVQVEKDSEVRISKEHVAYEWLSLDLCLDKLILPSHREGLLCFYNDILESNQSDSFLVKTNE